MRALKKVGIFFLTIIMLGCATVEQVESLQVGMNPSNVSDVLGSPELTQSSENQESHIYAVRYAPKWWAVPGCVIIPSIVPVTVVMWLSDACLGERVEVEVQYQDGQLTSSQIIGK